MKIDSTTAERIAPLLKTAVAARIMTTAKIGVIEMILCGPDAPESERVRVENAVAAWVEARAFEAEAAEMAERSGVADAERLLADLFIGLVASVRGERGETQRVVLGDRDCDGGADDPVVRSRHRDRARAPIDRRA